MKINEIREIEDAIRLIDSYILYNINHSSYKHFWQLKLKLLEKLIKEAESE